MLAKVYVVVPAGKATFVVPEPKVSVKIGSPELPVQKPTCAYDAEVIKTSKMNNTFVRLFLIMTVLIHEISLSNINEYRCFEIV